MSNPIPAIKTPKLRYGILPTNRSLLNGFTTLATIPAGITIFAQHFTATESTGYDSSPYLLLQVALIVFWVFCIYQVSRMWRNRKSLYLGEKRLRYFQRQVAPYIKRKYGMKITLRNQFDLGDLTKFRLTRGNHKNIGLYGSHVIEANATGERTTIITDEDILLVKKIGEDSYEELDRPNVANHDPIHLHNAFEDIPLEVFENMVKRQIDSYVSLIKPGTTTFNAISPDVSPEQSGSGLSKLEITLDNEGNVYYSMNDMKSLVNSIVFSVRMFTECLLLVIHASPNGPERLAGVLIQESHYDECTVEKMMELLSVAETLEYTKFEVVPTVSGVWK